MELFFWPVRQMSPEGGLVFDVYCHDTGAGIAVADVKVVSNRPLKMAGLLCGKSAAEGLKLLGLIYRICGFAQRYAGLVAWRSATGVEVSTALQTAQQLLVKLETLREHLWQVSVVWQELPNNKPQSNEGLRLLSILMKEMEQALFVQGQGLLPQAQLLIDVARIDSLLEKLKAFIEQQVCGIEIEQWQAINGQTQLMQWLARNKTAATRFINILLQYNWQSLGNIPPNTELPFLTDNELTLMFKSVGRDEFIAQPSWHGNCHETNAYTRQMGHELISILSQTHGRGLLTRTMARLVELTSLFRSIQQDCRNLKQQFHTIRPAEKPLSDSGEGLAIVEAARGRLVHWMKLEQGVIADYAILAPTEWNFHPAGVAVQGLKTLVASDKAQLKQKAALWICAIDPCVSYELRLH